MTDSTKKMRVADYIANFLLENGVEDIFMLTGNGSMYLNDAIGKSGINFYCARNEAAAPMMAEAYARVKGSLGAVCVTSGPGSTNAIPGLAEAWVDSAPILVLSGQVQRNHTTNLIDIDGIRSFGTQEIDIIPLVKPITKYAAMVEEEDSIKFHLQKAVYLATTGRPGPVWLDIPMDIQYALIDPDKLDGYAPTANYSKPNMSDSDIQKVVESLLKAKRPLILAGQGVRQAGAVEEIKEFVECANIPIIFSRLGQDLIPHSHKLTFGQVGIKGVKYSADIMKQADLILAVGSRMSVQVVGQNFDAFSQDAKVIMVDIEKAELSKPGVHIDLKIHADALEFLLKTKSNLQGVKLPSWNNWVEKCRLLADSKPILSSVSTGDPIDLYHFMSRLDAVAGSKNIFVTDAGSNYYIGGQVLQFNKGQREITSGCFAAMGLSIPLAIGSSIANKESQILAVTGDGSLELNVQELKTMSHYNLNIKLFVINNGGYVSMRNWQDGYFEGRRIESEDETGTGTLDLLKIASAFDLKYERIEKSAEIDSKLTEILKFAGPLFVEVVCTHNQQIFEPIKDFSS